MRFSATWSAETALRSSSPLRVWAIKAAAGAGIRGSASTATVRVSVLPPTVTATVYVPGATRGPPACRNGFSSSSSWGFSKVSRSGA